MGEILNLFQEVPEAKRLNGKIHHFSDKISGTTLYNMVGGGENATLSDITTTTGIFGNALSFDGADSFVEINNLSIDTNIFTISMYVKSTAYTAAYRVLFDTYPARTIFVWSTTGTTKLGVYLGNAWKYFDATPTDSWWHHICLLVNRNKVSLYLDGVQSVATQSINSFDLSGITLATIGAGYDYSSKYTGQIEDFKIFNRCLLKDEITYLANFVLELERFTAIKATWTQNLGTVQFNVGTARAGFEDQTDADGGTNLANLASTSVIDLNALGIDWADRYNYRIGGANIYRITEIILYKNGAVTESQTGLTIDSSIGSAKEGHFGANINPASRGITHSYTAAGVGYPKYL
jgi:hypothetical protein